MVQNEHIRENVGVAPNVRWHSDDSVRRVYVLDLTYVKKSRGIPKKTLLENIKNDISLLDLNENLILNRTKWRKMINIANPI
ncbi:hypothetical protein M5K25_009470 [Dendrobium thyrsiflorum]|uniref:Uncharacterized protein n=1 Tax=Dendrobium thyrsiflorum TaxID=117978 RepID=A0ABD0V5J4_DENTH